MPLPPRRFSTNFVKHFSTFVLTFPSFNSKNTNNSPITIRPSDKTLLFSLLVQALTWSTPGHIIWKSGDNKTSVENRSIVIVPMAQARLANGSLDCIKYSNQGASQYHSNPFSLILRPHQRVCFILTQNLLILSSRAAG